ncbi:uncharacterized protein BDV17DRAFT_100460 [Aspergillus undulatus]|uniref:uncharacterized protein n=1 Tax=Aspergillus undulatus TaxID=1810928 RepID=UPI003CCDAF8E
MNSDIGVGISVPVNPAYPFALSPPSSVSMTREVVQGTKVLIYTHEERAMQIYHSLRAFLSAAQMSLSSSFRLQARSGLCLIYSAGHHVVLCYLPAMGKCSAASAAASLRMSYRRIELALLLGVCGGIPLSPSKEEIILEDVIISSGIDEYDFERQNPDGFRRKIDPTEALDRPSPKIRSFLAALKGRTTRHELQQQTYSHLQFL